LYVVQDRNSWLGIICGSGQKEVARYYLWLRTETGGRVLFVTQDRNK
jgi:hypothetical protein